MHEGVPIEGARNSSQPHHDRLNQSGNDCQAIHVVSTRSLDSCAAASLACSCRQHQDGSVGAERTVVVLWWQIRGFNPLISIMDLWTVHDLLGFHHAQIFMRQDMAMEDELSSEVLVAGKEGPRITIADKQGVPPDRPFLAIGSNAGRLKGICVDVKHMCPVDFFGGEGPGVSLIKL